MAELNAAYQVLSEPTRRAQYDNARNRNRQADFGSSEEKSEAFSGALDEIEDRWQIACSIYPDLADNRARLREVSAALAFAYVATILTTKRFAERSELARTMDQAFLERYFSSDQQIIEYARRLIAAGQRVAARALNRLVDVVGVTDGPDRLIARIDEQFDLQSLWAKQSLVWRVHQYAEFRDAQELARLLGYAVTVVGRGFFRARGVALTSPSGQASQFASRTKFAYWGRENLCKH